MEIEGRGAMIGAIDIGGTKLAVGVVDESGRVVACSRTATDLALGPERLCEQMAGMLGATCRSAGIARLTAAGIGCGGPLDRASGTIHTIPNMPGWDGFPLRAFFEERLGIPVALDNDANAAGLGEARFGAGQGRSHVCYFTVSTGIGGGIVIDGRVFRGAGELAGEFGHQVIVPDGPHCSCGGWGCLEALASGPSIARRAREGLIAGRRSVALDLAEGDPLRITAALMARAARDGDVFALELWEETARFLGIGVLNIIHLLNPSVVVIGGGVAGADSLLFPTIRRTVLERGMAPITNKCEILPAALGDVVGIVGAAALAMEAFDLD